MQSKATLALSLLEALRGAESGFALDDYQHSLQTATRAERAGADDEVVVAALLHDVDKAITVRNHGGVAAEILAGKVRPEIVWAVGVHQDFTSIGLNNGRRRRARYRHVFHPGYTLARRFVDEWDLPSRDPAYEILPVEHFTARVHDVLTRSPLPIRRPLWRRSVGCALRLARRLARRALSRTNPTR